MKIPKLFACATTILLLVAPPSNAASPLPRSTPEAQGVSSAAIRAYVEAADQQVDTMHSFILVRHGHIVAEAYWNPESADKPHVLFSLSKSFTSTAVGLAVAEGKLSIDQPVLEFFPDEAPAQPSDHLKAMRVRDLLTMSGGHQTEPKFTDGEPWVKSFLAAQTSTHQAHRPCRTHTQHDPIAGFQVKTHWRIRQWTLGGHPQPGLSGTTLWAWVP
ncbi:MAG: serine hydrolase domain-containing protein [Verrucomicrobiota bacterium]